MPPPPPGRVCVPIETGRDMEKLESFDPFAVPTVKQICDEFITVKDEGNSSGTCTGICYNYMHSEVLLRDRRNFILSRS